MMGPLTSLIGSALARTPAMVVDGDGTAVTGRQLLASAKVLAHGLTAARIGRGDPVLCRIANQPSDLVALLAVWLAGGVAVPVSATAARASVIGIGGATGARLGLEAGRVEELSPAPAPARRGLEQAALIVFTSGSTGKPKGVVLGQQQLAGKLDVLNRLIKLRGDDTVVVALRLSFIFGIWVSLLAILSGARLVVCEKFSADGLAARLAAGASVAAVLPTMLRSMVLAPAPPAPRLRSILSGGETLLARLGNETAQAFPAAGIYDLYGLTETGSCDFCLSPAEFAIGLGSIGHPTEQVDYRIVDQQHRPVAAGAAGELMIKTPFGMLGYLDEPQLTADSYHEGFFATGDAARVRRDGRVELVGRLKDIIVRGGNKIAPAEIDALLATHPEVRAALCGGVPDPRLGEAMHAVVALTPGSELTGQALRSWAAARIEAYKVPDVIHIRDQLPTGGTGKLDRTAVARLALAGRQAEAG